MNEDQLIDVMRASLYPGASPASVRLVLGYCRARGLDPMKKPVHIVPMYDRETRGMRDVILPGITSYRIDAARTGEYTGKSEPVFGPAITRKFKGEDRNGKTFTREITFPEWCKVTVQRRGHDFTATELWLENYATAGRGSDVPNEMWAKRAYGQLAKCCEAQALRMAFPEETGGEITAEEMEGKTAVEAPSADPPMVRTLHLIDPHGTEHSITAKGDMTAGVRWASAARKAVAMVAQDGSAALAAWLAVNEENFTKVAETEPELVAAIRQVADDARAPVVEPDPEQPEPEGAE
jgi:phage recombination protein Bet